MAATPLPNTHPDYPVLGPIAEKLISCAGGPTSFQEDLPRLFRQAIDEVIDAPRTGRFTLDQTEKTEKTYLGTKIEVLLRNFLCVPRGVTLDLSVDGVDVDVKNTMGTNWSIPRENLGHPALLIRVNEKRARCDVGLIVVKDEYLRLAPNRDSKRGVSRAGFDHVYWLLRDHPYPPNFWEVLPEQDRVEILNAGGGTARLTALFERLQRVPISRQQVQALAPQKDYMKRMRRNGGARDLLGKRGIALLWGRGDRVVIDRLHLGPVGADEFISYTPENADEMALLREAGHLT